MSVVEYQISNTETLKLEDRFDKSKEKLYLTVDIYNTDASDELYRVTFVNKLRRFYKYSEQIPSQNYVQIWLDREDLEDEDVFSNIDIYVQKNDQLIKKLTYKTPHISELQQRFSEDIYKFDGEYIFNNINKSPIFICGAPGGGTSYIAKMLQYCGLFIGDDVCRTQDRKTFESTSLSLLECYFSKQILGETEYHDPTNIYWLAASEPSINLDGLEPFKKEFLNTLPLFWGNNELNLKWGFKKPFNMIWMKYLLALFPDARVLIVDKRKDGLTKNRSLEGKKFEEMSQSEYQRFTTIEDGLECNNRKCDFDKVNMDVDYFNEVMSWCELPTKTKEEHAQMLVDLKYDTTIKQK